jgi:transcriptional antiterminator
VDEYQYVIDSTTLKQRYNRIKAIITALENQQLLQITKSGTISYSLDDGQTRINTNYRSADDIASAIESYERILERIANKITGTRIVKLADAQSIQSNGIYRPF